MCVSIQQSRMISKRAIHSIVLVSVLALLVSACASSMGLVDAIPSSVGGLSADTPERPTDPPAYPAVHDMPPPRPNTTLTAEEQVKLETDLAVIKARQDVLTGAQSVKRTPSQNQPSRITPAASSSTSIY